MMERSAGAVGDMADGTWMGQLWIWMGKHDMQVRLRGASATSNNSEPYVVDQGFRGGKRAMVAEGCARAGVAHKSDLYMRDGKTLRQELRDGGEWEDQEWAKEVVQAYWAQGIDDDRVHQHDMPRVRANVGMVVSYYEGDGKRERRIGCVRRVYVGEHGVEYEVVCSEYRKGSSGRAAKVRRYEPRRGDVVTPGWNKSGQRMQVMWRGGSREGTRVSGEVVSSNDETRD